MNAPFPCPACGFLVFDEPVGSYEFCPLCNWQDDGVQLEAPGYAGGANQLSLYDHQQRVALKLAPEGINLIHGLRRLPSWRPARPAEAVTDMPDPRIDWHDEKIYYWLRGDRSTNESQG